MPNLNDENHTLLDAVFCQHNGHLDVATLRFQLHKIICLEPLIEFLLAVEEAATDQDSTALFPRHNNISIVS